MPREYTQKKKEYMERGYDETKAKQQAAIWFWREYGISVKEAHNLAKQGEWTSWKKKHHFSANGRLSRFETDKLRFDFIDEYGHIPSDAELKRYTGRAPYKLPLHERAKRSLMFAGGKEMDWIAEWEQEDYNGNIKKYKEKYNTKEEAEERLEQLHKSARHLGKHFKRLSIRSNKLKRPAHLLFYGNLGQIDKIGKSINAEPVDIEHYDDKYGIEYVVFTEEDREKAIRMAKIFGVDVTEEEFSTPIRGYKRKRGKGWWGEKQRHSEAARRGRRK